MKVTIDDIAKRVGVAKSTVSRYLNGGYVSEKNKQKINEAIKETGFETNFFAKRLKTNKSKLLGIVLPRIDSYTVARTLKGINEALESYDYQSMFVASNLDINVELNEIKKLSQQGVDGIVVISFGITQQHIELCKELTIPILFMGQKSELLDCMVIDDYKVGRTMGEYVKQCNHERIVYLSVTDKDEAVGITRKKGFQDAFDFNQKIEFIETSFYYKDTYNKGEEILDKNPSIVVCSTDNIALGLMRYLSEKNVKIPKEVSVAGFGGYEVGEIVYPSLTTIDVDYECYGRMGAYKILSLIDEKFEVKEEEISINLKIRESVKEIGKFEDEYRRSEQESMGGKRELSQVEK